MLTSFQIKLIAIATMLIDHIGFFFFPEQDIFRVIGRLSFPLFAWLIANGAYHTKHISNYLLRIFGLAVITQYPYLLTYRLVDPDYLYLNVVFTLGIGLLVIALMRRTQKKLIWILTVIIGAGIAQFLQADYGMLGVLSITAFYVFYDKKVALVISQIIITFTVFVISLYNNNSVLIFQPLSLTALIFIGTYSGKQGAKVKWLFYLFFPLHFLFIYIIKAFL